MLFFVFLSCIPIMVIVGQVKSLMDHSFIYLYTINIYTIYTIRLLLRRNRSGTSGVVNDVCRLNSSTCSTTSTQIESS